MLKAELAQVEIAIRGWRLLKGTQIHDQLLAVFDHVRGQEKEIIRLAAEVDYHRTHRP